MMNPVEANLSAIISNLSLHTDNKFSSLSRDLDVLYLFLAGDIVLFLQAGFAFMECGVVRSKNTTNILLKNLLDLFISGIAFWLLGYAFTRGAGNSFIGFTNFATVGLDQYTYASWFFDYVFASTASTIISGAVAERCEFVAYLIYSFLITGFVYPVEAHWCWQADGWLAIGDGTYHFNDFAGSGVVHMCGGVCGFVGAWVLGPRIGRFDSVTKEPREIKGHSLPFVALGGFILIFGIVSFNAGSQGHISVDGDGGPIAVICATTIITGAFGGMVALFISKISTKQWSLMSSLNGCICAMIAICAGGQNMTMWAAAVVGVVAVLFFFTVRRVVLFLRVDDPLDVVPVHFGGGFTGLIMGAILPNKQGWIFGTEPQPVMWLVWNICGAFSIIAWSAGCSFIIFYTMKKLKMLRVSPHMELTGIDLLKHGEAAYPVEGWEENQYTCYSIDSAIRKFGIHPLMASIKGPSSDGNGHQQPILAPLQNHLDEQRKPVMATLQQHFASINPTNPTYTETSAL